MFKLCPGKERAQTGEVCTKINITTYSWGSMPYTCTNAFSGHLQWLLVLTPCNVCSDLAGLPSAPVMASNRQLVGIFSRESQEAYDWLITFLLTISAVRDVRTVHISNTNYGNVMAEASKCAFAILYHTRNRGRINITDVTDSLYDRELEDLSRCLGRDKVIVVIDDLEDSSLAAKNLILQNQPSIGRWAVELFLFSDQEKTYHGTALCGNKMNELATLIKNADKKFRHGHPGSILYCYWLDPLEMHCNHGNTKHGTTSWVV
uniref:Uncharacterized protein n=1 Tax=Xenopus tropicalis TaxID=8364 RepID=A0A6I8S8W2_XENTR